MTDPGEMSLGDIQIPDHLPPLRRGVGADPSAGGCLMQVTNYLANGVWSDGPARNVMPSLNKIAIMVNDTCCDAHRNDLWRFVPRLMKTYDWYVDRPEVESVVAHLFIELLKTKQYNQHCQNGCPSGGCHCCDRCHRMISLMDKMLEIFDHTAHRRLGHVEKIDWAPMSPENHDAARRDWYYRTLAFNCMKTPEEAANFERYVRELVGANLALQNFNDNMKVTLYTNGYLGTQVQPAEGSDVMTVSWKSNGVFNVNFADA